MPKKVDAPVGISRKVIEKEARELDAALELTPSDFKVLEGMKPERRQTVLQNTLQRQRQHGLKPGEYNDKLPPDPPARQRPLAEVGKGGALSPGQREIGPELETPEVIANRPETTLPPAAPLNGSTPTAGGTVLRLPDFDTCDLKEGEGAIAMAFKILEDGGKVLAARVGQESLDHGYKCVQCGNPIPRAEAAVMIRARRNAAGMWVNDMWCSQRCYMGSNVGQEIPSRGRSALDIMASKR